MNKYKSLRPIQKQWLFSIRRIYSAVGTLRCCSAVALRSCAIVSLENSKLTDFKFLDINLYNNRARCVCKYLYANFVYCIVL